MRRDVWILVIVGAALAFVLWKGPSTVELVEGVILRVLGQGEGLRRAQLLPQVREALDGLQAELEMEYGIETYIGSTLRTPADQAKLVKGGTSSTESSWHLLGRAVDLYPIVDGKPDTDGHTWDSNFRLMHQVASMRGFRGLAFNSDGTRRYITTAAGKVWDGGHLEFREGMTFAQAQAQAQQKGAAA